jgi:hypothetical protein
MAILCFVLKLVNAAWICTRTSCCGSVHAKGWRVVRVGASGCEDSLPAGRSGGKVGFRASDKRRNGERPLRSLRPEWALTMVTGQNNDVRLLARAKEGAQPDGSSKPDGAGCIFNFSALTGLTHRTCAQSNSPGIAPGLSRGPVARCIELPKVSENELRADRHRTYSLFLPLGLGGLLRAQLGCRNPVPLYYCQASVPPVNLVRMRRGRQRHAATWFPT